MIDSTVYQCTGEGALSVTCHKRVKDNRFTTVKGDTPNVFFSVHKPEILHLKSNKSEKSLNHELFKSFTLQ